jgi:hypothetical protein
MCIIAFSTNFTGSLAAKRAREEASTALSGYRPDGRSLSEGHPAKDWQARPVPEGTRNVVRLSLVLAGVRSSPHALPDMT